MWSNKNSYILSKTYIDDIKFGCVHENTLNIEGYCAAKAILRLAKTKKFKRVKYFFEKYKKLIEIFEYLAEELKIPNIVNKFIENIKEQNYERACDYASNALESIKTLNCRYLKRKSNKGSYFLDDYFKIISSSAFRRLQDKTQLFVMEVFDYPRKRLTHSIEVSALAEKIANISSIERYLVKFVDKNKVLYFDKSDCATISKISGVLHDIGNPPFGHSGEKNIGEFFKKSDIAEKLQQYGLTTEDQYYKDLINFDGNAQSLRIASKLMSFDNKEGASLMAASLASIIKYPYSSSIGKDKIGYFLSEKDIIDDLKNLGVFIEGYRNPFACILEVADDLAYLISDLEDCVYKRQISYETIAKKFKENKYWENDECIDFFDKLTERYDAIFAEESDCFCALEKVLKPLLFQFRENLIKDLEDVKYNNIHVFEYIVHNGADENFEIIDKTRFSKLFSILKQIKNNVIGNCKEIKKNESKGKTIIDTILSSLFNLIIDVPITSLEEKIKEVKFMAFPNNLVKSCINRINVLNEENEKLIVYHKMRLIIDIVSGMTDSYASKVCDKIKT